MSRLMLCSLIASFTMSSFATASAETLRFAQPPSVEAPRVHDIAELPATHVSRAQVRAKLAKQRAATLARFRVYQAKGSFPNNSYTNGKLNVWRDELGNLCAAATIMSLSGHGDLVAQIADQNNFIRLGDVTSGPVMDWILTSGLTQAEIAAIQEPFMPAVNEPTFEPGPILVDAQLRRRENRRLIAKYKSVEARIKRQREASLDAATDRLMQNPTLASEFLAS